MEPLMAISVPGAKDPVKSPIAVPRSVTLGTVLGLLVHDWAALVSLCFLVVVVLAVLLVPLVTQPTGNLNLRDRLLPPDLRSAHPLGTDPLGRDMLARILTGTRVSLGIAVAVVAIGLVIGLALGITAGFYGGLLDDITMRLVDLVMGFPSLLLALIVVFALGPSVRNMLIVLVLTSWVQYTRLARAEVLKLRRFQYVEASRAIGAGDLHIMRRAILPNLVSVILTLGALSIAGVILGESSLSFLGLGIQPPNASLGLIVAQGKDYLTTSWWVMTFPGLMIFLLTMAFTLLANWVGIVVDPVQRWRLTSVRRASRTPR